ncbi:MAG: aggregation factor core [Rhizobiaceae bacterium]
MRVFAGLFTAVILITPAIADVKVQFLEGAPKDRFVITNMGSCDLGTAQVSIDLSGSPYGLIFDVTSSGAGVEVFQPLEFTSGADLLANKPRVKDGDNNISLKLKGLKARSSVSFTIDVDDTANSREITVSDSEFMGASTSWKTDASVKMAEFGANSEAIISLPNCT